METIDNAFTITLVLLGAVRLAEIIFSCINWLAALSARLFSMWKESRK